jgi:hypothetical protein
MLLLLLLLWQLNTASEFAAFIQVSMEGHEPLTLLPPDCVWYIFLIV